MKDWEKRFDDEFGKEAQSGSMLDLYDFYEGGVYLDIKHFIATALEEQRQQVLSEVLEMVKHQRLSQKDGYITDEIKRHQNNLRAELRTKLNQLKGSDE